MFKRIVWVAIGILCVYVFSIQRIAYFINNWYTNSESDIMIQDTWIKVNIPTSMWHVHKYILENSNNTKNINEIYLYLNGTWGNETRFPKNNGWLDFIISWMNTRWYYEEVIKRAKELYIDPDLVMSCVLAEQVRIANKWARGNLKNIIIWMTPRLLRSYNVSLGIGWIKVTTANQVKRDTKVQLWIILTDVISSSWLMDNDKLNAKYATFLVKNIITRRQLSWYDISNNPWVVCTIYNIGNTKGKQPNNNPQVWWSIININWKEFVYGWIAMWIYWYLKIYKLTD